MRLSGNLAVTFWFTIYAFVLRSFGRQSRLRASAITIPPEAMLTATYFIWRYIIWSHQVTFLFFGCLTAPVVRRFSLLPSLLLHLDNARVYPTD